MRELGSSLVVLCYDLCDYAADTDFFVCRKIVKLSVASTFAPSDSCIVAEITASAAPN